MSEVQSVRRKDASYPADEAAPVCESGSSSSSSSAKQTSSGPAPALWNTDYDKITSGLKAYDDALFGNATIVSKWPGSKDAAAVTNASVGSSPQTTKTSGCTNVIPSPPPPLPPGIPKVAPNAYRTIQLAVIAEGLPASSRSVPDRALKAGNYKLYPQLARQPDGSEACVYWTAYNTRTKRAEFVVGPNEVPTFISDPRGFENAAAAAYMNGEPNKWTIESMKTIDSAMRCGGAAPTFQHLGKAWLEAVKDPDWWAQSVIGAGAAVEARSASRAGAVSRAGELPASEIGKHTPIVEGGGLAAHEHPTKGHLLKKHVGKTEAEMVARANSANPPKQGVSAFYSRETAEIAASTAITENDAAIRAWQASGSKDSLTIISRSDTPVGLHVPAGGSTPTPVSGIRIVLIPDSSMSCGYRILTGFPTP